MTPPDPHPTPTISNSAPLDSEVTSAQWQKAEDVLRAHVSTKKKQILDLDRIAGLGTTFWVRYDEGGGKTSGGVAFVRGLDVLTAHGAATVSAVLRWDKFLETRRISAAAFHDMLEMLEYLPSFKLSPLVNDRNNALNPSWSFDDGGAVYTINARRPVAPHPGIDAGDTNSPIDEITRARLRIRPDYSLVPWVLEDVDLPAEREQR